MWDAQMPQLQFSRKGFQLQARKTPGKPSAAEIANKSFFGFDYSQTDCLLYSYEFALLNPY